MKQIDLSFDKKDVISVLNVDNAKEYIGQEGYFGNTLFCLQEAINRKFIQRLVSVHNELSEPFVTEYSDTGEVCEENSSLFLPEDKVKQKEKKCVACKSIGFLLTVINKKVGDALTYRKKGEATIHNCIITEELFDDYCSFVVLGSKQFSAKELFEDYEWRDKGLNWCPFGMEVEVEE